jgi:hypothetical protein
MVFSGEEHKVLSFVKKGGEAAHFRAKLLFEWTDQIMTNENPTLGRCYRRLKKATGTRV